MSFFFLIIIDTVMKVYIFLEKKIIFDILIFILSEEDILVTNFDDNFIQ